MPEPMPRPMRTRILREPALSLISLSRMTAGVPNLLRLLVDQLDEMANLVDHAAYGGRVLERGLAPELVEAQTDQGLLLDLRTAVGARDLLDRYRLAGLLSCHDWSPSNPSGLVPHAASAASPSLDPSRRRATISLTFLPRRAATPRGFSCPFRASNVARTML